MKSRRRMNSTRMLARKGANTAIRLIRPGGVRIRRGGMGVGKRIACRSLAWSGGRADKSAYRSATTAIVPPCSPLSKPTRGRKPPSTPMSGGHTTASRRPGGPMRRSATRLVSGNGHGTTTGMASGKSIRIRWKGSGRACGTSCARSAG